MNGPRDRFPSGSALAGHQDRDRRIADKLDLLHHFPHGGTVRDELVIHSVDSHLRRVSAFRGTEVKLPVVFF
jgi:hypothetical protein